MSDNTGLIEEIFCLKYELDTLSNVILRNESERWVPGFLHRQTENSHVERYNLACNYTIGKNVIDIACGIGKGTNLMATKGNAKTVKGFDIEYDAVRYAKWRNGNDNVEFDVKNAEKLEIFNEFDVAVSFETVEHLPNYKDFFLSIKNCLKPGGVFLVSTPISAMTVDKKPLNPYHIQEWGFNEFQRIISEFFDIEKIYVQLYPEVKIQPVKRNLPLRIIRKLKRILVKNEAIKSLSEKDQNANKFSKIEEFTGQFEIKDFGISRTGYQIILARRKLV